MTSRSWTDYVPKLSAKTFHIKVPPLEFALFVIYFIWVQLFWLHVTRLQAGAEDVCVHFNTLDHPVEAAVICPHAELHLGSSEADKLALVTPYSSVQRQSQSHCAYTGASPEPINHKRPNVVVQFSGCRAIDISLHPREKEKEKEQLNIWTKCDITI